MAYYCSARGGGAPIRRCPKCGKVQEMRHNVEKDRTYESVEAAKNVCKYHKFEMETRIVEEFEL